MAQASRLQMALRWHHVRARRSGRLRWVIDENNICPITDHTATMIVIGDRREFVCPACGRFQASAAVIAEMEHEAEAVRIARLYQARRAAAPDAVPFIQQDEAR